MGFRAETGPRASQTLRHEFFGASGPTARPTGWCLRIVNDVSLLPVVPKNIEKLIIHLIRGAGDTSAPILVLPDAGQQLMGLAQHAAAAATCS